MPTRWSAESILVLAPDGSSARAARSLAQPAPWTGTGTAQDAVWGLCQGSGANPYQTVVDLTGPAYKCSCPSRKFPCKHSLALLLLWSAGAVPDAPSPADYARSWLDNRRPSVTDNADSPASDLSSPGADGAAGTDAAGTDPAAAGTAGVDQRPAAQLPVAQRPAVKDEAAAAKRAADRAARVSGGLAELTEWLRDQVRVGLAASGTSAARSPAARAVGASAAGAAAEAFAARMVDAQAKGVAGTLRGLAGVQASGDGWPARLLSEYAMLHLLARAHDRLDTLGPDLAATVRSRIGYTTGRQEVLARSPVTDQWEVLGTRYLADGDVPARRIWLRGRETGRTAMLLTFMSGPAGWSDQDAARLRPGTEFRADLHFYPGQPPMRALIGTRHEDPARVKPPVPDGGVDALLAGYAAGLSGDPWLTMWPALLEGTPVPPADGRTAWHLADRTGTALPLAGHESLWTLLAVSGGHPVTLAGEWHPDGLVPLTVWLDDEAVAL